MAMTNHTASSALTVVENPEILKLQEEIKIKEEEESKETNENCSSPTPPINNIDIPKIESQQTSSNSQCSRSLPHIKVSMQKYCFIIYCCSFSIVFTVSFYSQPYALHHQTLTAD